MRLGSEVAIGVVGIISFELVPGRHMISVGQSNSCMPSIVSNIDQKTRLRLLSVSTTQNIVEKVNSRA